MTQELDRLVAEKVMGWKQPVFPDDMPDGFARDAISGEARPWSPSSSIGHAWEVMKKIEDHDHVFVVIQGTDSVFAGVLHYRTPIDYDLLHQAATAPLAICWAALAAVGARQGFVAR